MFYVEGHPAPPPVGGAEAVFEWTVDAPTLRALLGELERSARRTAGGARLPAFPAARGYRGRFYPVHGRYLWARDCNWWVVARLTAVGLAAAPTGVIFTPQVSARLRGFTRVHPAG